MDINQFLIEDLKLKVDYLQAQFQRMWTRFNFFVTIEAGLVAVFFSSGIYNRTPDKVIFASVAAFLAFIWWMFGAQDRYLVWYYRCQVKDVANKIADAADANDKDKLAYYRHRFVSAPVEELANDPTAKAEEYKKWRGPLEWRLESLSITRLAAFFPLVILLLWLLFILTVILPIHWNCL